MPEQHAVCAPVVVIDCAVRGVSGPSFAAVSLFEVSSKWLRCFFGRVILRTVRALLPMCLRLLSLRMHGLLSVSSMSSWRRIERAARMVRSISSSISISEQTNEQSRQLCCDLRGPTTLTHRSISVYYTMMLLHERHHRITIVDRRPTVFDATSEFADEVDIYE